MVLLFSQVIITITIICMLLMMTWFVASTSSSSIEDNIKHFLKIKIASSIPASISSSEQSNNNKYRLYTHSNQTSNSQHHPHAFLSTVSFLDFVSLAALNEQMFDNENDSDDETQQQQQQQQQSYYYYTQLYRDLLLSSSHDDDTNNAAQSIVLNQFEKNDALVFSSSSNVNNSELICNFLFSRNNMPNDNNNNDQSIVTVIKKAASLISMTYSRLREVNQNVNQQSSSSAFIVSIFFLEKLQRTLKKNIKLIEDILFDSFLLPKIFGNDENLTTTTTTVNNNKVLSSLADLRAIFSNMTSGSSEINFHGEHFPANNNHNAAKSFNFSSLAVTRQSSSHDNNTTTEIIDGEIKRNSTQNYTNTLHQLLTSSSSSSSSCSSNNKCSACFGVKKVDEIGSICTHCEIFNASSDDNLEKSNQHTFCFDGIERNCLNPKSTDKEFFFAPLLPTTTTAHQPSSQQTILQDLSSLINGDNIDTTICRKFCGDPRKYLRDSSSASECIFPPIGFYPSETSPFEIERCDENDDSIIMKKFFFFTSSGLRGQKQSCSFEYEFAGDEIEIIDGDENSQETVLEALCLRESVIDNDKNNNDNLFITIPVSMENVSNFTSLFSTTPAGRSLFSFGINNINNNHSFENIVDVLFPSSLSTRTKKTTFGIHINKYSREITVVEKTAAGDNDENIYEWNVIQKIENTPIFPFCYHDDENATFIMKPVLRLLSTVNHSASSSSVPAFSSISFFTDELTVSLNKEKQSVIKNSNHNPIDKIPSSSSSSSTNSNFPCPPLHQTLVVDDSGQQVCQPYYYSSSSSEINPIIIENISRVVTNAKRNPTHHQVLLIQNTTTFTWNISMLIHKDGNDEALNIIESLLLESKVMCRQKNIDDNNNNLFEFEQVVVHHHDEKSSASSSSSSSEDCSDLIPIVNLASLSLPFNFRKMCQVTFRLSSIDFGRISNHYYSGLSVSSSSSPEVLCKLQVQTVSSSSSSRSTLGADLLLPLHQQYQYSPEFLLFDGSSLTDNKLFLESPQKDLISSVKHQIEINLTNGDDSTATDLFKIVHFAHINIDSSPLSKKRYFKNCNNNNNNNNNNNQGAIGIRFLQGSNNENKNRSPFVSVQEWKESVVDDASSDSWSSSSSSSNEKWYSLSSSTTASNTTIIKIEIPTTTLLLANDCTTTNSSSCIITVSFRLRCSVSSSSSSSSQTSYYYFSQPNFFPLVVSLSSKEIEELYLEKVAEELQKTNNNPASKRKYSSLGNGTAITMTVLVFIFLVLLLVWKRQLLKRLWSVIMMMRKEDDDGQKKQ